MSFNTRDELGDKIDKLTVVISKLVAKDNNERRPFKPQIYKNRGQSRSYGQRNYRIEVIGQIIETEDNMGIIG